MAERRAQEVVTKELSRTGQNQQNGIHVRPAKIQISLGIRPVWSESSLCAQWVAKDTSFLHVDREDSDQTGRMLRLIWVFTGRTSWCGSIAKRYPRNLASLVKPDIRHPGVHLPKSLIGARGWTMRRCDCVHLLFNLLRGRVSVARKYYLSPVTEHSPTNHR